MRNIKIYIITLVLLFLNSLCYSQQKKDSVHFVMGNYWGVYSEVKEQPLLIEYEVKHCPNGVRRKGLEFYKPKTINTSDHRDYYKNVWDKGHMVPAASQNCDKQMIKETFNYLNCALQHQDLNRRVWRYLEEYERELSLVHNVYVIIVVEFKTNQRLKTGATIPSGFYKTIIINGGDLILKYYFPNIPPKSNYYNDYKIK